MAATTLASFIRRSDLFESRACGIGRIDGRLFGTVEDALVVDDLGWSGTIGRASQGPVAMMLPVSAISMVRCG